MDQDTGVLLPGLLCERENVGHASNLRQWTFSTITSYKIIEGQNVKNKLSSICIDTAFLSYLAVLHPYVSIIPVFWVTMVTNSN